MLKDRTLCQGWDSNMQPLFRESLTIPTELWCSSLIIVVTNSLYSDDFPIHIDT